MKFDFVIGNPPYQEENKNNGRQSPVYHLFMEEAFKTANCVEMIHPARFLFDAGQTPKAWNKKCLNDEHFKVLEYEADASKVFPTTEIKGGVAITIRDASKDYGAIKIFTSHEMLNRIVRQVRGDIESATLDSIISSRGCYRVTPEFFEDYPFASSRLGKGTGNMIASNFFEKLPEVWEEKMKDSSDYYGFLCRIDNKRTVCFIKKKYVQENDYISYYNVACPKSNGNGVFGEALTSMEIIPPNEGATDTFINIGRFETEGEANALYAYVRTKFFRALLGVKKVTQDNSKSVWNMIPLQDFTSSSDIDWAQSIANIDQQLYKKYNLSDEEINFIETNVKEME